MNTEWILVLIGIWSVVALVILVIITMISGRDADSLFAVAVVSILVAAVTLSVGIVGVGSRHTCGVEADGLGLESRWTYAGACQVHIDDRWIDIDKYRYALD